MLAFRTTVEIAIENARDAERVARAVGGLSYPSAALLELERTARSIAGGARQGLARVSLTRADASLLARGFERIAEIADGLRGVDAHEERQAADYLRRACP